MSVQLDRVAKIITCIFSFLPVGKFSLRTKDANAQPAAAALSSLYSQQLRIFIYRGRRVATSVICSFCLLAGTCDVRLTKQDYVILFFITTLQFFVGGREKNVLRLEQNEK